MTLIHHLAMSHQITQLMNTDILIINLTSVHQYIIDDIDEYDWWWMLEWNCQIRGNRGKTLKFAEVAQTGEFCKSCDTHEKFKALLIIPGADCWLSGMFCSSALSPTHLVAQSRSNISDKQVAKVSFRYFTVDSTPYRNAYFTVTDYIQGSGSQTITTTSATANTTFTLCFNIKTELMRAMLLRRWCRALYSHPDKYVGDCWRHKVIIIFYAHPHDIWETRELVRMQGDVQPVRQPLADHLHLRCVPHL